VVAWRIVAGALWVLSVACLFAAVVYGSDAEKLLYQHNDLDAAVPHLQTLASVWSWVGWSLQGAVAVVLSMGINSERAVRRIFGSLGVLIAVDGVTLLLMAVLIR
jgi:hypothetical protein